MPTYLFIQLFIFFAIINKANSQNQFYRIQPHDISALIGSNITIPCVITTPHGDVQWTKDGLALGYDRQLPAFPSWSIIGDETRGEFNFFIESLRFDDEGIYACEVSPYKDSSALKQIAHVRTLVKPLSVKINKDFLNNDNQLIRIRFDEPIHQIDCQVDRAKPAAHIKWFNETDHEYPATSRIFSQDRLYSTISTLTLVPSLSLHKKRFLCDVRHETFLNTTDILRTSFQIEITSPPNIPIIHGYTSTNYLINGSDLTLSCQSFGGYPSGTLSWYRLENNLLDNSTMIYSEENFIENNISLIIQPSDNNLTYSCQVTNDYLDAIGQVLQTSITLNVAFGPSSVQIQDNDMNITTLTEGIPRKFLCRTSSSNPPAIVTWKLDEQILPADINPSEEFGEYAGKILQSTKTIGLDKPLKDYHKKMLSCQATNPQTGHFVIDSTQLNVIYDATNIELHGIVNEKLIKSGDSIAAQCILTGGNPLGQILWYKGNELLPSVSIIDTNGEYVSSRVDFTAASSDHNLPLTCKGQVENFPQKITSVILNVAFLPEEMTITENNETYGVFECRTSISNPQAQLIVIRQTSDGEKHQDIQYKTSSSYTDRINSIQFMLPHFDLSFHENLLICQASVNMDDSILTKQTTHILYINHEPYFLNNFNSTYDVIENQSFNITLEAKGYPLPINYTWFHPSNQELINEQSNILINQGQLIILNVHRNDLGTYRCRVTNSIGHTEVNFTLNVFYGPIITRTQGYSISEALVPGSPAILLCVIDANPIDVNNIRWFKDNQEIVYNQWERRIEGKEVSIVHKSVQRDDAGEYICEIENQYGKTRASLLLVIQYPSEIDRNDATRNRVAVDSDRFLKAEFHCYLSAIPKPTVTWIKDNQTLPISSKYESMINERSSSSSTNQLFDAILYVSNIIKPDYGIYQCKAENSLGVDIGEITLSGLTSPDPPNEIQVTNISHTSALISWTPGFDGGAEQKFQIRYRLSKDDRYFYDDIPSNSQSFLLKNLKLDNQYHINLRSNNSYHMSSWSNEIIFKTLDTFQLTYSYLTEYSSTKISFTILIILAICGLVIFLINFLLLIIFIIKNQRKKRLNHENLSTTGTNETETNTIDLFQPIPTNFFLTNTYKKYEDDDIKKPFVSSFSSINLADNTSTQKDQYSPYDNLQLHQYYPMNFDNNLITYRSFKVDVDNSMEIHQCIQAELV